MGNRSIRTRVVSTAILLMTVAISWGQGRQPAVRFYVSPAGSDGWSGRLPDPDAKKADGPFATLERARDAVREMRSRGSLKSPVDILVRGGRYTLSRPLLLESRDSGVPGAPVVYKAMAGETPVVSGGLRITGWRPHRGKILRATAPESPGKDWRPRQLFFNGERQRLARYPNLDPRDPLYGGWAFVDGVDKESHTTEFRFEKGAFPRSWARPAEAQVVMFPWYCWVNDIVPLRDIDVPRGIIRLGRPLGHSEHDMTPGQTFMTLMKGNRFYVENLLEELDEPGEWCFDGSSRTLYFWPPEALRSSSEITVPLVSSLVDIRGTKSDPAGHIAISGLTFTQTETDWPARRSGSFHSPALNGHAIRLENAGHCTIEDNLIYAPGGDGIRLQGSTVENLIAGNEVTLAGGMGVSIVSGDVPGNTHNWKNRAELEKSHAIYSKAVRNRIFGNHIHHCGVIKKNGGGIHFFGISTVDNVVSENKIHHMPDKAITMQDGLGSVLVERNYLHDLALEISDTGAIMTNRWFPYEADPELAKGNVFRYNRIYDVAGCGAYEKPRELLGPPQTRAGGRIWTPYFTWGIYLDNSGSKAVVQGNIVARTVLGGFGMPVGDPLDNRVENNIFAEASAFQVYMRLATASGNIFRNNIIFYRNPGAALFRINGYDPGAIAEFDRNVYFHGGRTDFLVDGIAANSLEAWRGLGHDRNSVVADPLFVDAEKDDYRLRPESPALRLGFKPLDAEAAPAIDPKPRPLEQVTGRQRQVSRR